jgi:prepilin signal peptidase PulO-like enzyme (type II secretory pathway)
MMVMTAEFDWILLAAVVAAAVFAWLHTVFAGRYAVKPRDPEHVINLPLMGTVAGLAAALAAFLTGAYTLIPAIAGLFGLLALFAATDYYYRTLPNVLTGYTAVFSLVVLPFSLMYETEHWVISLLVGAAIALAVGVVFLVLSFLFAKQMGMGDVKLAPSLAFWVGSLGIAYGTPIISPDNPSDMGAVWLVGALAVVAWLFLAFLTSTVWTLLRALFKSIRKNAGGDTGVPFGIFLALATVIAVIAIPYFGQMYAPTPEELGVIF